MLFDKYKKTYQMYKENKEKLEDININKNEINRINRSTFVKNKISKLFNGPFSKRTYNNFNRKK